MENFDLAKRVKGLRTRSGFSQEHLADLSGLSLRTIQRVENGKTIPRGDTLKRLGIALEVSPDEIIDWKNLEDNNVLLMLNFSQLGFLVFPFLGILIPLAIWLMKKDTIMNVNEQGKSILNFQITWIIGFLPVFIFGFFLFGPLISIILLYLFNVVVILMNTLKVYKKKPVWYKPDFSFLN
jgi:transcriptional regulator with XRE-family HTH domain